MWAWEMEGDVLGEGVTGVAGMWEGASEGRMRDGETERQIETDRDRDKDRYTEICGWI